MKIDRRKTVKTLGLAGAGITLLGGSGLLSACSGSSKKQSNAADESATQDLFFSISLAQWSLHRAFFNEGKDPAKFPIMANRDFGINAVEYVNAFYKEKKFDAAYWNNLKSACDGEGVQSLLIMCDGEGHLGDTDEAQRKISVENHYQWVDNAKVLGCHSIRVNAAGNGSESEVKAAAIDGLGRLTEYGSKNGINIIVENHGGYSSNGSWLAEVISQVGSDFCGTLPDFGNFCIDRGPDGCVNEYDRYQGTKDLMPYAKGVSAKSHDFDVDGNEMHTDYTKMLKIVKESGFSGFIGVEYEGDAMSEYEGIVATKKLLEKVGRELA